MKKHDTKVLKKNLSKTELTQKAGFGLGTLMRKIGVKKNNNPVIYTQTSINNSLIKDIKEKFKILNEKYKELKNNLVLNNQISNNLFKAIYSKNSSQLNNAIQLTLNIFTDINSKVEDTLEIKESCIELFKNNNLKSNVNINNIKIEIERINDIVLIIKTYIIKYYELIVKYKEIILIRNKVIQNSTSMNIKIEQIKSLIRNIISINSELGRYSEKIRKDLNLNQFNDSDIISITIKISEKIQRNSDDYKKEINKKLESIAEDIVRRYDSMTRLKQTLTKNVLLKGKSNILNLYKKLPDNYKNSRVESRIEKLYN